MSPSPDPALRRLGLGLPGLTYLPGLPGLPGLVLALAALSAWAWAVPAHAQAAAPLPTTASTPALDAASGDAALLDMGKAYKRGDRKKMAQLLPTLRGHALEPWAAYWELKTRLSEASAAEVQGFLARYAGSYQEDRLRNDWLLLLGQRRDWTAFAAEHPQYRMGDDREVRCYALLVEALKSGPASAARNTEEVRKNWLAQRDADDGCTAAATHFLSLGKLAPADVWLKARLAVEANRPRAARDAVAMVAPESLALLTEAQSSPAKFLNTQRVANPKLRQEIITLALVKLASSDADGAAHLLESKWASHMSRQDVNWVWGVIGKQAATRLGTVPVSQALAYFAKVSQDTDLNDEMLGWKARAALRADTQANWPLVLAAVKAMSNEGQRDPTWVYWKARALLATLPADSGLANGQRAQAAALLQSIASVRGFYEQLALEDLGQKVTSPSAPAPLTADEKEAARLNLGLNRAAYAIAIGLRPEGVREWNYSTNLAQPGGMGDRELLAAAQFACDRAIWDRCINTSERTRAEVDMAQRFPTPHRDAVVARSQALQLDPAYVYGLIRQESRFIMDAKSGPGAAGLMQVMPATARETARRLGMQGFSVEQLIDKDTNIAIGTGYLKMVLDDLGGSLPLAAAAYNAGPGRPRVWRGQAGSPTLDAAIWAENVPFSETRDYVKKVLSNTTLYAARLTGQAQSLKARLGTVGPRESSLPPADKTLP